MSYCRCTRASSVRRQDSFCICPTRCVSACLIRTPGESLANLCTYDRDPATRDRLRASRDITSEGLLERRLNDLYTDRRTAMKRAEISDEVTLKAIATFASLPLMVEAGGIAAVGGERIAQGLFRSSFLRSSVASLTETILPKYLANSAARRWAGRALSSQEAGVLLECYASSWVFSQSLTIGMAPLMLAMDQPTAASKLWTNPLSQEVIMGAGVFRILRLSHAYVLQGLGEERLIPMLQQSGVISGTGVSSARQMLGLAHDTTIFTGLAALHPLIDSMLGKHELTTSYWGSNLLHSYLTAVVFRSSSFYPTWTSSPNQQSGIIK